ncbi:MAG: hypothetical protein JW384_01913 [Nitrosomonadaceae bacterium]|nr:hypothetical protein [Nitrosomonadaceae bacterium]
MTAREEIAKALLDKLQVTHDIGGLQLLSEYGTLEDHTHNLKIVVAWMLSVERNVQEVCAGFVWQAAKQTLQAPTSTIKGDWFKDGAVAALQDAAKRLKTLEIEPQEANNDRAPSGTPLLKLD